MRRSGRGVLQIVTAGAGTEPGMPESEYRHLVQVALDGDGLRYQMLDTQGEVREWLGLPPSPMWEAWNSGIVRSTDGALGVVDAGSFVGWWFRGESATAETGHPQTLLTGWDGDGGMPRLWVGLTGSKQRLCALLSPAPGRSPHLWMGPQLAPGQRFDLQIGVHGAWVRVASCGGGTMRCRGRR